MITHYLFPNLFEPRILVQNHKYRKMENFYEFSDNLKSYIGWEQNEHHYTTETTWNVIFPKFMADYNIEYNKDNYHIVERFYKKYDISYHDWNDGYDVDVYAEENIYHQIRKFDRETLTEYHHLYVAPHQISMIINKKPLTDRILRMNCDSMTIPLIPLITPYFKKIYVYDYRCDYLFKDTPDITDEFTGYIIENVFRVYGYI